MNTQLLNYPKPATATMKNTYHLIIEDTNTGPTPFDHMINVMLVNTENFTPIFDISTQKKYEQNIVDMVTAKYGDDLKIYHIKDEVKPGKRNI